MEGKVTISLSDYEYLDKLAKDGRKYRELEEEVDALIVYNDYKLSPDTTVAMARNYKPKQFSDIGKLSLILEKYFL